MLPLPVKHFRYIHDAFISAAAQELTRFRSCYLQCPRLRGLVRRERYSRRPTDQRRQYQRSWLCWHHHHRGGDMARHCLRL